MAKGDKHFPSEGGGGLSSGEVQELIDNSLSGLGGDDSGIISGFNEADTGFTKTITTPFAVSAASAPPFQEQELFTTGADIPDGEYTFQIQVSGVLSDTVSLVFCPATPTNFIDYVTTPILAGDYSSINGTYTLFYRKVGSNIRYFFPAKGSLPTHYSQRPSFADLKGDPSIKSNGVMSMFFAATTGTENLTIESFRLEYKPIN